jgi:hypothetical protein
MDCVIDKPDGIPFEDSPMPEADLGERVDRLSAQIAEQKQFLDEMASRRLNGTPPVVPDAGFERVDVVRARDMITTQFSSTGEIAYALVQLEGLIIQRDIASRNGDASVVARIDENAAALACVTMDRALEELAIPDSFDLDLPSNTDAFLRGKEPILNSGPSQAPVASDVYDLNWGTFTEKETALLRLAGLSDKLAKSHVQGAVENYRRNTNQSINALSLRMEFAAARDAVCATHDELRAARHQKEQRMRRRKRIRLLSSILGGTLLASANAAAGGILLPPLIAASAVLGGGAAGAVVNLVE